MRRTGSFSEQIGKMWCEVQEDLQYSSLFNLSFGSYKMKLNRKLRQRCWLEVKHFVLDDILGCWQLPLLLSILTSMSVAN